MNKLYLRIPEKMKRIPVYLGSHLWPALRDWLAENAAGRGIWAIADDNVARLYRQEVTANLGNLPNYRGMLGFPPGDEHKNRDTKEALEDALLQNRAGRDTILLAFGGGVTTDLVGFLAATLHRGVPVVYLSTSLLGQVDAAIGGKVGVNHPAGKNLIGAFYQPQAVFLDQAFLKTLPEEEFANGMAEVLKYGMILDESVLEMVEDLSASDNPAPEQLTPLVKRCVELKIAVVEKDEKESRYRAVLNFGHTVAHALEQLSEYQIPHGFAVAWGMIFAARLSRNKLGYPSQKIERLENLLALWSLLQETPFRFHPEAVWQALQSDKKARQGKPLFTLIDKNGRPALFREVSKEEFFDVFRPE
ncbi:MAG: 3-dehydroquinate synthase [Calditrichia bacterium]